MSLFRWMAPILKQWSRRWTQSHFDLLAEQLRPTVPPGGVFADLGGGTGELGAGAARALDARVVIIDSTPQMLARVVVDPRVSVTRADAGAIPFPEGYFDGLLVCDAFHHFRDQDAAVREMARVVRDGGGVVLVDMNPTGGVRWIRRIERLLGEPGAFMTPSDAERFFGERGIVGRAERLGTFGYLLVGTVTRRP